MTVKPIPDGYRTVTPYLVVQDVPGVLAFIEKAWGAEVVNRMAGPDGTVMHAEARLGDSMLMFGAARNEQEAMPAMVYLYVEDCDDWYKRAIEAGAESVMEPADQFYGDRNGGVKDCAGNQWWIGTHKEDLSPDEIMKRAQSQGH